MTPTFSLLACLVPLALFLVQTLPWHRISTPLPPTRIRSPPPLSLSFSSPPRRQADDDEHGYFPTEDSRRPEACQAGVDEEINTVGGAGAAGGGAHGRSGADAGDA